MTQKLPSPGKVDRPAPLEANKLLFLRKNKYLFDAAIYVIAVLLLVLLELVHSSAATVLLYILIQTGTNLAWIILLANCN